MPRNTFGFGSGFGMYEFRTNAWMEVENASGGDLTDNDRELLADALRDVELQINAGRYSISASTARSALKRIESAASEICAQFDLSHSGTIDQRDGWEALNLRLGYALRTGLDELVGELQILAQNARDMLDQVDGTPGKEGWDICRLVRAVLAIQKRHGRSCEFKFAPYDRKHADGVLFKIVDALLRLLPEELLPRTDTAEGERIIAGLPTRINSALATIRRESQSG